jgi:hypothetical protein
MPVPVSWKVGSISYTFTKSTYYYVLLLVVTLPCRIQHKQNDQTFPDKDVFLITLCSSLIFYTKPSSLDKFLVQCEQVYTSYNARIAQLNIICAQNDVLRTM